MNETKGIVKDLTNEMLRVLRIAERDGAVVAGKGAHAGRVERVNASTVLSLLRRGLLSHTYGSEGHVGGRLTDAGRAALGRTVPENQTAHATKKRSVEWLRGERHGARAAAEKILKYGRSNAELALRDLRENLRRGEDIEDFDRGYTHAYETVTLKASRDLVEELGRPLTKAELERDIQEALGRKLPKA